MDRTRTLRTPILKLTRAAGCAWRGRYLDFRGRQVARIILDPTASPAPRLSISFGAGNWSNAVESAWLSKVMWKTHVDVSLRLPTIPYRWVMRFRWLYPVYNAVNRFWFSLDGRYSKSVRS